MQETLIKLSLILQDHPLVDASEGFSATCLLGLVALRALCALIFYPPEGHGSPSILEPVLEADCL